MFDQILLKPLYIAREDNILNEFYIPVMKDALIYNRASAYFSSQALCECCDGIEHVALNNGKICLILSEDIEEDDFRRIKQGYDIKDKLTQGLISKIELEQKTENNIRIYSNLAFLIANDIVDIKVAFMRKGTGVFHYKFGYYKDANDNEIVSGGSDNFTDAAINQNGEQFSITCSWQCSSFDYQKIERLRKKFNDLWANNDAEAVVLSIKDVVQKEIMKYNKGKLIMDNAFLKEDCYILDYDNNQLIGLNKLENNCDFDIFCKIYIRRYIESNKDKKIAFKQNLSYIDILKIISLFKEKVPKINLFTTYKLDNYIKSKQLYLDERKTLGLSIKNKDKSLKDKLEKYKLVLKNAMHRELREQQLWDSFYMYCMKKCSNFSVPGSGKTSSVLGVYAYLQNCGDIDKIVVICPKNAFNSWKDEFKICFKNIQDLNCFDVQSNETANRKHYILNYETKKYNLFLFNYESLNAYKKEIKNLVSKRTLLVYDEVHKAKGLNGERATNAIEIAKDANYTITMTGTPIPNSYLDIYNNLHILYPNEYDSFFAFREQFLKKPNEHERKQINEKIKPFYCRTSKEQLLVPIANDDLFFIENATHQENRIAEILYSKYKKNKFALIIRLLQLESCPELLLEKLDLNEFRDILDITDEISELDYSDVSLELENLIKEISVTTKTQKSIEIIKKIYSQEKSVIVWTLFRKSISNISNILSSIGIDSCIITGDTSMEDRKTIIDKFLSKEIKVLITNPQTLAESVSLHSTCHDAIYFEYSYNLVHLLQSKDRIHRLGLPQDQYTQYYYMQTLFDINGIEYSLDKMIYDRLKLKEQIMIDAVNDGNLEQVFTEQEDVDAIFEKLNILN